MVINIIMDIMTNDNENNAIEYDAYKFGSFEISLKIFIYLWNYLQDVPENDKLNLLNNLKYIKLIEYYCLKNEQKIVRVCCHDINLILDKLNYITDDEIICELNNNYFIINKESLILGLIAPTQIRSIKL